MNNDHLVDIVAHSESYMRFIPQSDPRVLAALRRVDRAAFVPDLPMEVVEVEKRWINQTAHLLDQVNAQMNKEDASAKMNHPEIQPLFDELLSIAHCLVDSAQPLIASACAFAYNDTTLPIGDEQTCSQPSVVAIMTELLKLREGMRVLEIGTGCGYHAAVTAEMIGPSGHVVSIERIPALAALARGNLQKHFGDGLEERVTLIEGNGVLGVTNHGIFDRIYFTAAVDLRYDVKVLAPQINAGDGIVLYPTVPAGVLLCTRFKNGSVLRPDVYPGFAFVPLKY